MPMKCSTYLDEQKAKNDVLIHHEAFKSYSNKKSLEIEVVARY